MTDQPKLKLKYCDIDKLVPYVNNARTHSEGQIDLIAGSIKEFGFNNPVLLDGDNGVVAGHGRLLAARKLGMVNVPTIELGHLSETQKRAYILADNRLASEAAGAGWNEELLGFELKELNADGLDLGIIGFSLDDIPRDEDPEEGPTEEPPVDPVTAPGDIWLLDDHRVICGDSTDADDVAAVLNGTLPHLMVTDPPYGVNYDPDWRNRADRANGKPYGASAVGRVKNDDRADWTEAYALFPGDVFYCWHPAGALQAEFFNSLVSAGFEIRTQIIWSKPRFPIGRGHYHVQHEACWYGVRKGKTGHWQGSRKETTVWSIAHNKSETGHGTQKPLECMRRPIVNNSKPGDLVYDPFLGSGTTIIAAETVGRSCYGLEIDPGYCDVIVRRWEQFTEKSATLAGSGRTFAEVAAERKKAGPSEPVPA